MKQGLSTSIDFYLQTQKINPFHLHINSNASSQDLIDLRNNAYIINKLSLLSLQHPSSSNRQSFQQKYLQLFVSSLETIIMNPLMPFRDFQTVKDLISHVQNFYYLLEKLTFLSQNQNHSTSRLKKKLSINSFWPRVRSLFLKIQQQIPKNRFYIRQYVTIRRGLLEPDKNYFLSNMMAKKIQTNQLRLLIDQYSDNIKKKRENTNQVFDQQQNHLNQLTNNKNTQQFSIQKLNWSNFKKRVRMILLQDNIEDWNALKLYVFSQQFKQIKESQQKQQIISYLKDILDQYLKVKYNLRTNQIIKKNNKNLHQFLKDSLLKTHQQNNNINQKTSSQIQLKSQILAYILSCQK